jgi:hypothetical protein
MKISCFLAVILPLALLAQEVTQQGQLTEEQKNTYERRKMSIAINGVFLDTDTLGLSAGNRSALGSRRWLAYQGTTCLPEARFFLLTGHPQEAAKAMSYTASSLRMTLLGGALMVVGGTLTIVGASGTKTTADETGYSRSVSPTRWDPNPGLIIGGTAALAVGSALVCYYGLARSGKSWAHASLAQGICDDHNKRLIEEITRTKE